MINPICFIDLYIHGGITEIEKASCITARYNKGFSNHRFETSGVLCSISSEDFIMEILGGGYELASCLGTKSGDIWGKHQVDDAVCVPVHECGVLRSVRNEYGKQIRKEYETGNIDVSRHDFLEYEIKEDGQTNTLSTVQKDNMLAVPVREATRRGYSMWHEGDTVNFAFPDSKTRRGRIGVGVAQTLDTSCNQGIFVKVSDELTVYAIWYEKYKCYVAIRRLTPKECFRLQGWTDEYFEKAQFVNSDSQLYKQAGNGVTVDVITDIAKRIK